MIPQNELRIGNWLYFDSPAPGEDFNQTRQMDNFMFMAGDKCFRPIPITDNWLIMLGFEKRDHRYVDDYYCLSIYLSIDCYGFELTSDDRCDRHFIKYVKHIHELQNLYFALTGKELELKQNA